MTQTLSKKEETTRIDAFDLARFIGISIVILQHSAFLEGNVLVFLTSFSMPLFFIVSGYFFCGRMQKKPGKEDTRKRLYRLLLPYACFSLLYLLIYVLLELLHKRQPDVSQIIKLLLQTISLYGPSVTWFLSALFFSELLLKLFFSRKPVKCILAAILSGVGILLTLCFGSVLSGSQEPFACFPLAILRLPVCALWLFFGCLLYWTQPFLQKLSPVAKKILAILLFPVLLLITYFLSVPNGLTDLSCLAYGQHFFAMLFAGLCGSLGTLLLCAIPQLCGIRLRIPSWYGRHSLTILLTHLDLRILYLATIPVKRFFHGLPLLLLILAGTLLLEIPLILCLDKYFPFAIGKKVEKRGQPTSS